MRYSSHESPAAYALQTFCQRYGLHECIKQPTRNDYLLDLFLTDMHDYIDCEVLSSIADHDLVLARLSMQGEVISTHHRKVFDYNFADWKKWSLFRTSKLNTSRDSDSGYRCYFFKNTMLDGIDRFIPQRSISLQSSSHSWINQRCLDLVRAKDDAFGTSEFKEKSKICSRGLFMEYQSFISRQRSKLQQLRRRSKK